MDVVTFGIIVGIILLFLLAVCYITIQGTCKSSWFFFISLNFNLNLHLILRHTRILLYSLHKMPNSCFFPFIFASALVFSLFLDLSFAHGSLGHHQCTHSHGHHQHAHHHHHDDDVSVTSKLLPEELAEEEDMRLYGFGRPYVEHDHESVGSSDLSGLGNP